MDIERRKSLTLRQWVRIQEWRAAALGAGLVLLAGCGTVTENDTLPFGAEDPAETRTAEGAVAAYRGVRVVFEDAFHQAVLNGAWLTDELGSSQYGSPVFGLPTTQDRRHLPEDVEPVPGVYAPLHAVRGQASEAIGLLATYGTDVSPALRGHAYALAGYAETFLADLFCSGIPLSTVDFDGNYTFRPGSTTAEVYQHAAALFDTAITLVADSARVLHLAQVGKARALLALGQYAEAGQAVAAVPDGFSYAVEYDATRPSFIARRYDPQSARGNDQGATMTDREGGNGLPYLSNGDPRVAAVFVRNNDWNFPIYRPGKYAADGTGPIVVADWVEARLIAAEAALHAGGDWLGVLNALRTDGTFETQPNAGDPAQTDTLWHAGTGGVAGLRPLEDPGNFDAQLDLIFEERAYWLFVTGHRQGDLRRLVREYGRDPEDVYPSGAYPDGQGNYGSDVTIAVPRMELDKNPHYTGCAGRGA